jgi:hypothetical protein
VPVDSQVVTTAKLAIESAKNQDRCLDEAKVCADALAAYQAAVAALDGYHPNWSKVGAVLFGIAGFAAGVAITGASFGGAGVAGCAVAVGCVEGSREWWNSVNAKQAKLESDVQKALAALQAAIAALNACLN